VRVEARVVASILFSALYSPLTASVVPTLVDAAERNEFQSLFALGLAGEGTGENMSIGMQLSVLCSEDAGSVTPAEVQQAAAGTVFGLHLLSNQLKACEIWPRGVVEASYYEPVVSDVPALVLSGDLDPVTPPTWGESVVKSLKNGRHITVPGTGHGAALGRAVRQALRQAQGTCHDSCRPASQAVRLDDCGERRELHGRERRDHGTSRPERRGEDDDAPDAVCGDETRQRQHPRR
jgi:hypothetical protein